MVLPRIPKQYEAFVGGYTGALSTFTTATGMRYVFSKPLPRIEKGRRYMMVIEGKQIRLLPLVMEVGR